MQERYWSPEEVEKMISNPYYTGITVNPKLCADRPKHYDLKRFIEIANEVSRKDGPARCIELFLSGLKVPTMWTILVPVHPCFCEEHEAEINEWQFTEAFLTQLRAGNTTVTKFFTNVAENLSQGVIPLPKKEALR